LRRSRPVSTELTELFNIELVAKSMIFWAICLSQVDVNS
jgi:hypothetical protein